MLIHLSNLVRKRDFLGDDDDDDGDVDGGDDDDDDDGDGGYDASRQDDKHA